MLADLILHVVDAAAPEERRLADMRAVDAVLEEIGAGEKPRLLVLNKADLLDDDERDEALLRHPDAVLVSALTGEGLDELRERIEAAFEDTLAEVELLIPYSEGARLHELHEVAGDLERTEREDGVLVTRGCRWPSCTASTTWPSPRGAGATSPRTPRSLSTALLRTAGSSGTPPSRGAAGRQAEDGADRADAGA